MSLFVPCVMSLMCFTVSVKFSNPNHAAMIKKKKNSVNQWRFSSYIFHTCKFPILYVQADQRLAQVQSSNQAFPSDWCGAPSCLLHCRESSGFFGAGVTQTRYFASSYHTTWHVKCTAAWVMIQFLFLWAEYMSCDIDKKKPWIFDWIHFFTWTQVNVRTCDRIKIRRKRETWRVA